MCEYCMPISAYDKAYLEREKINYMSFHAWLRKLSGDRKERDVVLDRPNFRVLTPCPSGHAPWPASMCAKCQPNSVTLQSQVKFSCGYPAFLCHGNQHAAALHRSTGTWTTWSSQVRS